MDRNSLLAFLLIAVIIFLMPEYYKLVYPPTPGSDSLIVNIDEQAKSVKPPDKKATLTPAQLENSQAMATEILEQIWEQKRQNDQRQ